MNKWNNGKYILLKGFAKNFCGFSHYQQNLENSFVVNHINGRGGSLRSVCITNQAPVNKFLESHRTLIEDMVSKKFKLEPVEMRTNGNMMQFRDGIPVHNDWFDLNENHHPDAIVARGILTINPTYVFGTDVYDWDAEKDEHVHRDIFGGYPGDLFIFKCTPDSWHSVGNKTERHVDRYSINIMFKIKQ